MHLVPATIVSFLLKAKNGLLAVRGVSVHGEGEEWWWMVEIRSLNVADSLFFFLLSFILSVGHQVCVQVSVAYLVVHGCQVDLQRVESLLFVEAVTGSKLWRCN